MLNLNTQSRIIGMIALIAVMTAPTPCGGTGLGDTDTAGKSARTHFMISSTAQVAQAATAALQAGHTTATFGVKLHDLADQAGSVVNTLPDITFFPVTFDCSDRLPILFGDASEPNTATLVRDRGTGVIRADFNTCRIGETAMHGKLIFSEPAPGTQFFTMGSVSGEPIIVSEFAEPASQVVVTEFAVSAMLTFTKGAFDDTLVTSGFAEVTDRELGSRDRFDLGNVSLIVTKGTEVIGVEPYDVTALFINGAVTRTSFFSDIDPTVSHTESNTFSDFDVVFKTPAASSTASEQILSVNGQFSIATTPPARCIDGTFTVMTDIEAQFNEAAGTATAGQVTVNSSGIATFTADGGISASHSGGLAEIFTREEIIMLCALGTTNRFAF